MTRRVPFRDTAKAMLKLQREVVESLEVNLMWHALRVAYEYSLQIAPVDTGKARSSLNPSAREPVILEIADRPAFPAPGAERLLAVRVQLRPGDHTYLVFYALDSRGVFDYAGIMLEEGYSPQAPNGVLRPTAAHVEAQAGHIAASAAADTYAEVR